MLRYAAARALHAIPLVLGIVTVAFAIVHLVPGDPGRIQLGPRATEASVRTLDHRYGLDAPLLQQYVTFLRGAIQLDFGDSFALHASVVSTIASRAAASGLLVLYSVLVALVLAVPLGIATAVRQRRLLDHGVRLTGMVLYAMPPFWLGLLLSLAFGLKLGWLPTSGYESSFGGALRSLTLPALTIGLIVAPLFVRTLRASVIETLTAPFVESAQARGLGRRRVLYRHVLRNSSIPLVTLVGLVTGFLISGTVIVENVFAIPGLGQLLVTSVSARDFPVVQGLTVVFGVAVIAINLLTDLAYAVLDPRVRL